MRRSDPHTPPRASAPIHALRIVAFVVAAVLLSGPQASAATRWPGYQFISPLPGSRLVTRRTEITIRQGGLVDPATLDPSRVVVTGSSSGAHPGALVLSDDGRTMIFKPDRPFVWSESVRLALAPGIRTTDGRDLPALDDSFTIAARDPGPSPPRFLELPSVGPEPTSARAWSPIAAAATPSFAAGESLPPGYPPISLMLADRPDTGVVLIAPFTTNSDGNRGNLVVVDDRGKPVFYRGWPAFAFDFKRQPNGLLTFFTLPDTHIAMDSTYTVVDSFKCGNGYAADEHDLQLLPNGHALLIAQDLEYYPMDTVVVGGNPNAWVIGLIIQELDQAKNVVFQWRSWDHFLVTDMTSCVESLTDSIVDYVHANSIEPDLDGNLLLSSRHMSEVTKIDRSTGDVLWRLGLHAKNNQFTFLNDPRGFSNQHDVRRQPDGHLTVFDNGNCLSPTYSRVSEYRLDEANKTAELVWQYRNTPDTYTPFMGNQQRHPDGAITIGWGGTSTDPKVTELHADGTKAFELGFGLPNWWSYRAFRFPWRTTAFVTDRDTLDFAAVGFGDSSVQRLRLTNRLATPLSINSVSATNPAFTLESPLPLTIAPGATDSLALQFVPTWGGAALGDLYVRAVSDTDLIAQVVALTGTGIGPALSIDDVALPEGNAGATPFAFTVSLSEPASRAVSFDYACIDSNATASSGDYLPVSGSAVIPQGDTTLTIPVQANGDTVPEPNEVFIVALSNLTNALIARPRGIGTILDDDGYVAAVGGPGQPPPRFALREPRPNPASGETSIDFELAREGPVSIEVFDVRGRRVATIAGGVLPAGHAVARWDTRSWTAGIYFVRMRAGEFRATRKLVLVR